MKHYQNNHKGDKKYFQPEVVEVSLNPNILDIISTSSSSGNHNLMKTDKKINSANNQHSKIKNNKKLFFNSQNSSQSQSSLQTPEISTRYKFQLEKLNSNINSLNNKYDNLIKEHFKTNAFINDCKIRFIQLKKQNDKEKTNRKKQQYLKVNGERIKRIREEEKKYIQEGKENQQINKIKEIENRKKKDLIKKKKEAEIMLGNKVYSLKKKKNELE